MDKKELIEFLKENKENVDKNDYDSIYENLHSSYYWDSRSTPQLTDLFIRSHINPLIYLKDIPNDFAYELNIENIYIPDNVEEIPMGCFANCYNLKSVNMPKNLKVIGKAAFLNTALDKVILPEGVESIKEQAFCKCNNLKEVYIPKSVKHLEAFAFYLDTPRKLTIKYGGTKEDFEVLKDVYKYIFSSNIKIEFEEEN